MQTELPVCERCCFCLLLRCGLITWGYVRWAVSIFFLVGMFVSFYSLFYRYAMENGHFNTNFIVLGFLLILAMTDVLLNTVFIFGGHKKNLDLSRPYYIYSNILCTLTGLIGIIFTVFPLSLFEAGEKDLVFSIWVYTTDVAVLWGQIFVQIYMLLLVRSEIVKLRSNCRFVNNATDAECTDMNAEHETQ